MKDDLVESLAKHLNTNETTFAKLPEFRDYYGRNGSPVKRERSSPTAPVTVTKTTRRRTIIKEPSEEEPKPERTPAVERSTAIERRSAFENSAVQSRTPKPVSRRVSEIAPQVDIPPSPAQLAEVADQSLQIVKTKATEIWDRTRIDELKEFIRENASSVATIQTIILLIEAVGLQWNTLGTTPLFAKIGRAHV